MLLSKDSFGLFEGMNPGVVGLVGCECLFARLKTKKMFAEKYLVRHYLGTQQASAEGDLEDAYWLPVTENPADSLTKVRSDMVFLLRLSEPGAFCPGHHRPLEGVAWEK